MPPSQAIVTEVHVLAAVPLRCRSEKPAPCTRPPTRVRFFRDGEAATYCDVHQELARRPEYAAIGEARLHVP